VKRTGRAGASPVRPRPSPHRALIAVDAHGTVCSWNGAAERLYALPAADVIGRDLVEVLRARTAPKPADRADRVDGADGARPAAARPAPGSARAAGYAERVRRGESLRAVARAEGLTPEGVRKILRAAGHPYAQLLLDRAERSAPTAIARIGRERLQSDTHQLSFWAHVRAPNQVPQSAPPLALGQLPRLGRPLAKPLEQGCWLWEGHVDARGYGIVVSGGRAQFAHRLAYQLVHGRAPSTPLQHTCGQLRCVNPDHLRPLQRRRAASPRPKLPAT
jgi:hypothetical protein